MSGVLVAPTFVSMTNLRDVNDAAKADGYAITWDSGTAKHVYTAVVTGSSTDYVKVDGTQALTANWDAGSFKITAETFASDIATGTAPLTVASTTVVTNLNADQVDGCNVIDEDNMASDSATNVPTQQSVKAYVDNAIAGLTYLQSTDIDTLAEINAILGDATLVTVEATDASGYGWVIDEDNMASDSATKVPTQQSVKAYVDAISTGDTLPVADTTGIAKGSVDATKIVRLEVDGLTTATTRVLTVQDADGTIALTGDNIAASQVTSGTLTHERGGLEFDASSVAIGDVIAGTGAGTMGLVTATGHSDGDVLTIQADGTVDFETPAGGVTDHGALTGLSDDDHSQYLRVDGTRAGTGVQEVKGLNLTDATELTISAGAVTVTQGYHTIDTESDASTDDLDTITAAKGQGDILYIRPVHADRTIVVKHETGNIKCVGNCDITLDDVHDVCQLVNYDGTNWMATPHGSLLYCEDSTLGTVAGDTIYYDADDGWTNQHAPGAEWSAQSAVEANAWNDVAYGNGLFVAVSTDGTNRIMTSEDGINWTARSAAEANTWHSVTYGNGLFVAVSSDGTNRVMTSSDGITWTARSAASANYWHYVTYGNGLFVGVSNAGHVMTSPDGITWTSRTAAEANSWQSVVYRDGLFVAVSSTGTNRVMTSPDGITWTARTAAEANSWRSVTYGNGLFVAISTGGTNRVMTSPDGITWTARSAAEANFWTRVTYGNGLFVAVSNDGTNRVMTSPDGITWTARSAAEANEWESVTYGNGLFVGVSTDGTNRVMVSGKQQDRILI